MKLNKTIGAISIAAALALSGCGSSGSNSGAGDNASYAKVFKKKSVGDQVEELMGGVIGIADEVGSGKMGDHLGESIDKADTTKVESQFSWILKILL